MPKIHGGDGPDSFTGEDGADELWGGGGNDIIHGGAGNDALYADRPYTIGDLGSPNEATSINFLYGEAGNDFMVGGVGKDTLDGGDGDDQISGGSGDTLIGGSGADRLMIAMASTGAIVDGGAGDDRIDMGGGANRYTGGVGADLFTQLYGGLAGVSTITDFNSAEGDRLGLGGSVFTPYLFRGAVDNPNFSLKLGDVFSASRDYGSDVTQVWTWANNGGVYVITDADGSRTLSNNDVVMRLEGLSSVASSDFADGSLASSSLTLKIGTDAGDTYVGANSASYFGLAGDDVIRASNGGDRLHGGSGNDQMWGGGSRDYFWGGDGDDRIDGGGGLFDTAVYSGLISDYVITRAGDGSVRVQDLRGIDGVDALTNIHRLEFADGGQIAISYVPNPAVEAAFKAVLRMSSEAPALFSTVIAMSDYVTLGSPSSQINKQIIKAAAATTSVASMAYEFFTGKVPSAAGVDYLVSPTGSNANNLNSAYYQSFNLENRYINFAVNLGKQGEGKDAFLAKYGSLSFVEATREAYKTIFGAAPTDAKVHALIDSRVDYFASYGGDGAAGLGTKAAMVGWLLAEAIKADVGVMAKSNGVWLAHVAADGTAPFAIDILDPAKGYWKADFVFGGT